MLMTTSSHVCPCLSGPWLGVSPLLGEAVSGIRGEGGREGMFQRNALIQFGALPCARPCVHAPCWAAQVLLT